MKYLMCLYLGLMALLFIENLDPSESKPLQSNLAKFLVKFINAFVSLIGTFLALNYLGWI